MSGIADKIKIAQDRDGMLRRALERIIQLYTDKSHFVYELLQNAEDAEATQIRFVQYPDRLEVMHDGKPFTTTNLQGLCDIGHSDKVDQLNQIGEFGVGFKSVFGICETVRLYSEPSRFRDQSRCDDAEPFAVEILDFTRPEDIEATIIENPYTTKFVFPYSVGQSFSGFKSIDALKTTLSRKLQNLGITTLLFMKSLESIEYSIRLGAKPVDGEYLLEKKVLNDHCILASALGITSNENNEEDISYLRFSRKIDNDSNRTVDIAFPIRIKEDGTYEYIRPKIPFVSVYFPTETESKLKFIVQGPYRTTPNRSSIPADEEDNKKLARETSTLLKDSIIELKESGMLNMSFLKALPVSPESFENFNLFYPLYNMVKDLYSNPNLELIPCHEGGYVSAKYAKITRQERIASLIPDNLLTLLVDNGHENHWLPTILTETNKEYQSVYRFLTSDLKIPVVRPEDLRFYFSDNPMFLYNMSDDWLVDLYTLLENIPAAFSKVKNETNMLTADIIKTSSGAFVAAYRKTENKQYIPNVFIPSKNIETNDINFVDSYIYSQCRHFFDDILNIEEPDEYEFIIKDIRKRYGGTYHFEENTHIADIKNLIKYSKYSNTQGEVETIIKDCLVLKCLDGELRSTTDTRIYLPVNRDDIRIKEYFRNIVKTVHFVDAEFYFANDISPEDLIRLGVRDSILSGDTIVDGVYETGKKGPKPAWSTWNDFRWKLSLDSLADALMYISQNPNATDSIFKSQTILKSLFINESRLVGTVHIGGSTPNLENESCDLIKTLLGEKRIPGWNGKWLYTETQELVSQKEISKHDINVDIYGKLKADSAVYELLAFRKTESDQIDELRKNTPKKQLDAFFESELLQRFGISSEELTLKIGSVTKTNSKNDVYEFPIVRVKNWEALRKHAAEMLTYADPVKYQAVVRSIRVSDRPKEKKAYLHNMYRYDGVYKYACQMCHDSCSSVESVEIFSNPEIELDPMNLCLCPNCATKYRNIRSSAFAMKSFKDTILKTSQNDISHGEQVKISLDNNEIWFTQTHFAEVQELLILADEIKASGSKTIQPNRIDSSASYVLTPSKKTNVAKPMQKSNTSKTTNLTKPKVILIKKGSGERIVCNNDST